MEVPILLSKAGRVNAAFLCVLCHPMQGTGFRGKSRDNAHNKPYWALREIPIQPPAILTRLQLIYEHLAAQVCRVNHSAVTLVGGHSLQCRYRFSRLF